MKNTIIALLAILGLGYVSNLPKSLYYAGALLQRSARVPR